MEPESKPVLRADVVGAHDRESEANPELAHLRAVVDQKLIDILIPGFIAEFDPDEAQHAGAFEESGISVEDALEASVEANVGVR